MILDEATYKVFGYHPSVLSPKSSKLVLAACEDCGGIRKTTKGSYRHLCNKCAHKNDPSGEEHPLYKERVKCVCKFCGKKFNAQQWQIKAGGGIYCSHYCYGKDLCGKPLLEEVKVKIRAALTGRALSETHKKNLKGRLGADNPLYKGGRLMTYKRHNAKRKRQLGYTVLMPLKQDEVGHHVTNEYVIGIPAEVHLKLSGGASRKKHRTLVLQWLKANDKKKYIKVLCVLASES